MTTAAPPLSGILARTACLLLDFDGPVCRLFAGVPAPVVAGRLRDVAAAYGATVPDVPTDDDGPIQVLCRVAGLGDERLTRRVADQVRDREVEASATATPTPGAAETLRAAWSAGLPVAVVSNNATAAVRAHLQARDLHRYVTHVAGRYDGMDPRLLKPDTHLVDRALGALGRPVSSALFVGDSLSDVRAARAAGVPVIGYANRPGKRRTLADAGADAVIDTMTELAEALSLLDRRPTPC